jgi:beta-galactosidase GanA
MVEALEIFDRRGLAPMQEIFQRQGRWEAYFDNAISNAQVAILYSRYSQDNYGKGKPYERYVNAVRGYYNALLEAHIPFDVLSDKFIDAKKLEQYQVLVLPNATCLSDCAVKTLIDYAISRRCDCCHF